MDLDSFVVATPRPLPVILLLDTSGSMEGVEIAALNAALKEMAQDLGGSTTPQREIQVGLVVFENNEFDANLAIVATDFSGTDTLAHELGHILTRGGHFKGHDYNLMARGDRREKEAVGADRLRDAQVENIRDDVLGYLRS